MRKFYLLVSFACSILSTNAQITWDGGGGDNQWTTAANWVGDAVPVGTDNVLLDNSVVTGTYSLVLPAGTTSVSVAKLVITPAGANTITLTLPNTNTANPGLSITGTGDALILNNGAILKNSSGASGGSGVAISNTFRINNGGHYIHNTGRTNAGIVSQLSTATGTELGEFEFDVPTASYTLSLSNRTYGSLTLSAAANAGTASYSGSGANPLTIKGNFTIRTGTSFSTSMSANIIVQGNFIQAASSTFNMQSSSNNNVVKVSGNITAAGTITESGTGFPTLELNGTTNQNITIAGTVINSVTFSMNNTAGATLLAPLSLPFSLQLTNGKIATTPTNLLTLMDDATYTGGSSASFIEGPMKKIGNDNFVFPVGVGSIYAPIGIENVSGESATDEFTAQYIRNSPKLLHGGSLQAGLNHTSLAEYWNLVQNAGTAVKKVSLKVNTTSFCYKLNNTFVSRWNGSLWTNEGSTNTGITSLPPFETGTITSVNNLSTYGDFTLATDLPFTNNPLPVELISFDAQKLPGNTVLLTWNVASKSSPNIKFEIEKSKDKITFSSISKTTGEINKNSYSSVDNSFNKGVSYYRLKTTDEDGKISYSKIIYIINEENVLLITSLFPNPVQQQATIVLAGDKDGNHSFLLYNSVGKIIKQWNVAVVKGENQISFGTASLSAGIYFIASPSTSNKPIRFVKQ